MKAWYTSRVMDYSPPFGARNVEDFNSKPIERMPFWEGIGEAFGIVADSHLPTRKKAAETVHKTNLVYAMANCGSAELDEWDKLYSTDS